MRLSTTLALLSVTLPAAVRPQTVATPTGIVSLASLVDHARPLLIFAATPNDPQLVIQLRRLQANASAVADRDIAVIAIPWNSPSPTAATLTDADALAARRRFHIAPADFAVILLGKDGGEKLRSSKPLSLDTLRNTIDAMPMRQDELRSRPKPL
jgi:hypothetical protein